MIILLAILVFTGVMVGLSLGLLVAERVLVNYGECTIDIDVEDVDSLTVRGGAGNLMNALFDNKILIPSACGGQGTCGYCTCKVLEGGGPVLPTEEAFLDKKQILPCAAYLEGEYGVDGAFVGVPVKLGKDGIEQIIEIKLDNDEQAALNKSVDGVRELLEIMKI